MKMKTPSSPLAAGELSDLLNSFALESSGLIVFAGGPGSGRTTSSHTLAERIAATGRSVVAISAGPAMGTAVRHRPVDGRSGIPDAVRAETASGTEVLVVDSDQDVDSLSAIVGAAAAGALVVATLNNRGTGSYSHLLNLIEAAEDWDGRLRADFDASLRAVVTQDLVESSTGAVLEAEVHHGRRVQK
jgi:Tfp pilus assembly pilus retraction ATPase PilT